MTKVYISTCTSNKSSSKIMPFFTTRYHSMNRRRITPNATWSFLFIFVLLLASPQQSQSQQQQQSVVLVGTDLGGGVITRTDVSNWADLMLDVRDISQLLRQQDDGDANASIEAALQIYIDGKNARTPISGSTSTIRPSLARLSTQLSSRAGSVMAGSSEDSDTDFQTTVTPPFLFQLYGLSDRSVDFSTLKGYTSYADQFVRASFQRLRRQGSSNVGAAAAAVDAVLVLNVWMYSADLLYRGASTCQRMVDADNPSQFRQELVDGGLDQFMALWIGSETQHGSSQLGYSLYTLTERANQYFSTSTLSNSSSLDSDSDSDFNALTYSRTSSDIDNIGDEASVNVAIKALYEDGSNLFDLPNFCTKNNIASPQKLWSVANRLVVQMYIPLVQMLIVSVLEQDVAAIETYAQALIPQTAQCRPSTYKRLREELLSVDGDSINQDFTQQRTESILRDIQNIYSCFGITCNDVGSIVKSYDNVNIPNCMKTPSSAPQQQDYFDDEPMALYRPTTDVHPIARIDLDVLQLRILTSLGSFHFAKLLYTYGRNSPRQREDDGNNLCSFYSISEFAISSSRRNAEPYYSAFVSYYNDPNYADTLIRNTLHGVGKWDRSTSTEQRSAVIAEASAFLVLYLHLHAQINSAVNTCHRAIEGDEEAGEYELTHPWDEVAALMIGSLEGPGEGGSGDVQDGQLVWGLGTRRSFQFQTTNSKGYAKVNDQLDDLLFAGRGEMDAFDCSQLATTTDKMKTLLLVPLMQSVLKYAIQNEQLRSDSTTADLALGEVFAMSLIPVARLYDQPSSKILEDTMIVSRLGSSSSSSSSSSTTTQTRHSAQDVANALGTIAIAAGLKPRQLGSTQQADPCQTFSCSSASSSLFGSTAHYVMTSTTATVLVLGTVHAISILV